MKKITVVLSYGDVRNQYHIWAHEENDIDFRKEKEKADRCTLSFAAEELEAYLKKLGMDASVEETLSGGCNIILGLYPAEGQDTGEEFHYRKEDSNFYIEGTGRVGVLYGVYEFLQTQGICWLSPWEEVLPVKTKELIWPELKKYAPSFPMGRGFEFEGALKEADRLYLWMARNKLNLSSYRFHTAGLQKKLGMIFKQGGHIFERIMNPDNVMPSGKIMWEEHQDWYGLPADGVRNKDTALSVQFCMSNDELLEYLSEKILKQLQNEWYQADRIDVWGFDTWGNCCQCERCKALGNSSDQSLYFMSYIRDYLDKAYEDGRLDRRVNLVVVAYEGTCNLKAPLNAVPENLRDSGDYISYAPIVRCFEHLITDENCAYNRYYNKHLRGWKGIAMGINEYYNVSKFEDLPLVFADTVADDLKYYHSIGIRCMTYMHLPMMHWGVKNLTQMLYARLCFNVNEDKEKLLSEYFAARYGSHAEAMKKVYELLTHAGRNCSSWRAWCGKSILSNLQQWDGAKPSEPLFRDNHLDQDTVGLGMEAVREYEEAAERLEAEIEKAEKNYFETMMFVGGIAVNQTDTRFKDKKNIYGDRLTEDLVYVLYGLDCQKLITLFVAYYEALEEERETEGLFTEIDTLCRKMLRYYIPVTYENPDAEIICKDALTRCQLKELYYRCKARR